jgi:RNA polymerase sigma factor (sigma-70 family)
MTTMSEHRAAASRHLSSLFGAGALGSLSDGELLRRFLAGRGDEDSASAFAALVERHGPMVLGVCRRALGNLHDAEDAAQATFLILARRGGSIRRAESLAHWLFSVALKVASKRRAQAAKRIAIEQRGAEMRAHSAGSELSPEVCTELYEELERLPERFRAPIVLCHLEGLSNEQAAGRLGLPVRTVQRRLSAGRERLRHRLARLGLVPAFDPVVEAASENWIEATVQAAAGLAAGRAVGAVASAPVAALVDGTMAAMLAARAKAITAAVLLAASLAALGGVGAWFVGGRQAQPPAAKAEGARSAPPSFAGDGRWVKGIVVDESGKPVAGARVALLWGWDPRPQSVISGVDGTFAVEREHPRWTNQEIIATADGGARQGMFRYFGPAGYKGPRTLARVVLRPAQLVTVTVVDKSGAPVPDAAVFVLNGVTPVAEARTDARGIAVLHAPADAWTQWIVGAKPGAGFDYFENYRTWPAFPWTPPPRSARLVLNGPRTVRVRAVNSAGQPVAGVELYPVQIQKKGKLRSVNISPLSIDPRTDANGVATFDWLPADLVYGTSFYPASLQQEVPDPPVFLEDKPGAELTAHVLRPTRVSGRVTHPDGSPAAGIRVEANGVRGTWRPGGSGRAWTAADGSYEMHLAPEQSYTIAVVDDEWAAKSVVGVVVREGVPQTGRDLPLVRGAVIHGRITAGPESKPSAGSPVALTEHGPAVLPETFKDQPTNPVFNSFERVCNADEDGRYAFRVAPGQYRLEVPRERGDRAEPEEVTIVAGRDLERNFHLPRDVGVWRTVRGVVRAKEAGGPPIAGAVMVLQTIEVRDLPVQDHADDQGRFDLLRLTGGKVILYARSPAGDFAGYAVIDGDDDREINLVARPATTARGRVVDEHGKPWAGVDVYCVVEAGLPARGRDGPPGAGQSVTTDDDGRFAASGLPVGATCHFRADASGAGSTQSGRIEVKDARPIEVPPLVIDRPRPLTDRPAPR